MFRDEQMKWKKHWELDGMGSCEVDGPRCSLFEGRMNQEDLERDSPLPCAFPDP